MDKTKREFLGVLATIFTNQPDLRVGQIIEDIKSYDQPDLYYTDDKKVVAILKAMIMEYGKNCKPETINTKK